MLRTMLALSMLAAVGFVVGAAAEKRAHAWIETECEDENGNRISITDTTCEEQGLRSTGSGGVPLEVGLPSHAKCICTPYQENGTYAAMGSAYNLNAAIDVCFGSLHEVCSSGAAQQRCAYEMRRCCGMPVIDRILVPDEVEPRWIVFCLGMPPMLQVGGP